MKPNSTIRLAGALVCASVLHVSGAGAATETVVYQFEGAPDGTRPHDGAWPSAGLVNVNGLLYGTTVHGGSNGYGTVFSVDPSTGNETVVYSFCQQKKGCVKGAGFPYSGLININGTLYGTTAFGGNTKACPATEFSPAGCGTVFSINPSSGVETVLHSFAARKDGTNPYANLINVNGTLYGTTGGGGASGNGTVFSINPTTGAEKVLYSFAGGSDGEQPDAGLIDMHGTLYGTTYEGGTGNCSAEGLTGCGTVFSLNPTTGAESAIYTFQGGNDGASPAAGLINLNGTLYGTTEWGGDGNCDDFGYGCGTVFSVNPKSGVEKVLHSFRNVEDGMEVLAGLISFRGTLYGTTWLGGNSSCSCGIVFSVNPTTGAEKLLYSFAGGSDGDQPDAGLINIDGIFYGTTEYGGTGCYGLGCGTVFEIKP